MRNPFHPRSMRAAPELPCDVHTSPPRARHALLLNPFYAKDPHASFGISGDGQITRETRVLFADVGLLMQEIYTLRPRRYAVHADLKTVETYLNDSLIKKISGTHFSRTENKKTIQRLKQLEESDPRWVALAPDTVFTYRKPTIGWTT